MCRILLACLALMSFGPASGQSLTPQAIAAMIDERQKDLNPYRELLNNPDPARSLAAMNIMLDSGDPTLISMAKEFGLLSNDMAVRKAALQGILATKPTLMAVFGGRKLDGNMEYHAASLSGTYTPDHTLYVRFDVAGYSEEMKCFAEQRRKSDCFLTINADGIFMSLKDSKGLVSLSDDGKLVGVLNMYGINEPVPISIRLLE